MTIEEMAKRIAELEAETERLKQTIDKAPKPARYAASARVLDVFRIDDIVAIGRVVRRVCFGSKYAMTAYENGWNERTDQPRKLKDLTEREYAKYTEIIDMIFDILSENRFDPSLAVNANECDGLAE